MECKISITAKSLNQNICLLQNILYLQLQYPLIYIICSNTRKNIFLKSLIYIYKMYMFFLYRIGLSFYATHYQQYFSYVVTVSYK
jgi:hypothetical protein